MKIYRAAAVATTASIAARLVLILLLVCGGAASAGSPRGTGCEWVGGFHLPGLRSFSEEVFVQTVLDAVVFDDGGGSELYVGGYLASADDARDSPGIYKWDGAVWSSLPSVPAAPIGQGLHVRALAVHDDGGGPKLYAGGNFGVARLDGASWTNLNGNFDGFVQALTSWNSPSGRVLVAGGTFTVAGGGAASRIARWNGVAWSALGAGVDGEVDALAALQDGPVHPLYVGGNFANAGGLPASRVARWNGAAWSPLGTGLTQTGGSAEVRDLMVWNDGTGAALYAGGLFSHAGGLASRGAAKWTGSAWSSLGGGVAGSSVTALGHYVDGGVDRLYALTQDLEKFQGGAWSVAAAGVTGATLVPYETGLYAGGKFRRIGDLVAHNMVRWNGAVLTPVTRSPHGNGFDGAVKAMAVHDDGTGKALYVAGTFHTAGDQASDFAAKWDGRRWWPLPGGSPLISKLITYDDSNGPALYRGSYFAAPFNAFGHVARLDGETWTTVSPANFPAVTELEVFDPGTGPLLVAFGLNPVGAELRSYDGTSWTLDDDVGVVREAEPSYDLPGDPSLFGATILGNERVARWDGVTWSAVPGITDGEVKALQIWDDGNGPALYVGGSFLEAEGAPADYLVKWDGVAWSEVGGGVDGTVHDLEIFDDGRGDALYVGGNITTAGGEPVSELARWDGQTWSSTGGSGGGMVRFADAGAEILYFTAGGVDGQPTTIFAQYCQPYAFADGFESGDASAWSSATP